jgi:hypothetical protein
VVDEHFKPKKPEKKVTINPVDSAFFSKMTNANRRKFIPLSYYDRSITKSYEKKKKFAGSSDVPQLGAQKKQSIEPLVVQPTELTRANCFSGHLSSLGGSSCRA